MNSTNSPSSLYKETGVSHDTPGVSPTTPLERAKRIYRSKDGGSIFGRHTLTSTVDARVPDKAYRILSLMQCCCWDAPAPLAYEEIAFAVNSSRPQVIRHVKLLESLAYIAVRRTRNRPNEYSVPGITGVKLPKQSPAVGPAKPAKTKGPRCPECRIERRGLLKTGICRSCTSARKVRRIVREEMAAVEVSA